MLHGTGFRVELQNGNCVNPVGPVQVSEKGSLTAEEFAKLLGLSVLLSKERYVISTN